MTARRSLRHGLCLATAIGALFIQAANAHGIWTEQRRGQLEVVYGHGAEDDAYVPEKIKGVWAYDKHGGMVPVSVERLSDHARMKPLQAPAVVAVALDNGVWSKVKDGKSVNAPMDKVPGASSTTHSYKYSLAILEPHATLPSRLKLAMVIRPLADPTDLGVGKPLPVEVLIDGKPAPDISIFEDYRGMPEASSVKTDAKGRAEVIIRNAGLNIIAAQATVPGTNGDMTQRSLFSSLSFVGESHHH